MLKYMSSRRNAVQTSVKPLFSQVQEWIKSKSNHSICGRGSISEIKYCYSPTRLRKKSSSDWTGGRGGLAFNTIPFSCWYGGWTWWPDDGLGWPLIHIWYAFCSIAQWSERLGSRTEEEFYRLLIPSNPILLRRMIEGAILHVRVPNDRSIHPSRPTILPSYLNPIIPLLIIPPISSYLPSHHAYPHHTFYPSYPSHSLYLIYTSS